MTCRQALKGTGSRWSEAELRLRMVDAGRLNPATIMPSFYRVDGLTRDCADLEVRQAGAVTAEQIEDGGALFWRRCED